MPIVINPLKVNYTYEEIYKALDDSKHVNKFLEQFKHEEHLLRYFIESNASCFILDYLMDMVKMKRINNLNGHENLPWGFNNLNKQIGERK